MANLQLVTTTPLRSTYISANYYPPLLDFANLSQWASTTSVLRSVNFTFEQLMVRGHSKNLYISVSVNVMKKDYKNKVVENNTVHLFCSVHLLVGPTGTVI